MKKFIALAAMAVGMLVGAGSAAAGYPVRPVPTIGNPGTVAPGAEFSVTVANAVVGETVSLTMLGQTSTKTVESSQGVTAYETGSVTFTLTAPNEPGTYNIDATTSGGDVLYTSVTVSSTSGPTIPQGKNDGSGSKSGSKSGSGGLPATGANMLLPFSMVALAALAGGLGLIFVSRRRRHANT